MTINELIRVLQTYPQDLRVVVYGYEEGYDDLEQDLISVKEIRLADSNNLLASTFAEWDKYVQARIDTTHDYDAEKAQQALELMDGFIDDASGLYQTMSGETRE